MKRLIILLLLVFSIGLTLDAEKASAENVVIKDKLLQSTYTNIANVAPLATPSYDEFTLENGESYKLIKKFFIEPNANLYGSMDIKTTNNLPEMFSLQVFDTNLNTGELVDHGTSYHHSIGTTVHDFNQRNPTTGTIDRTVWYEVGFILTNYSPTPITYRATTRVDYIYIPD